MAGAFSTLETKARENCFGLLGAKTYGVKKVNDRLGLVRLGSARSINPRSPRVRRDRRFEDNTAGARASTFAIAMPSSRCKLGFSPSVYSDHSIQSPEISFASRKYASPDERPV